MVIRIISLFRFELFNFYYILIKKIINNYNIEQNLSRKHAKRAKK